MKTATLLASLAVASATFFSVRYGRTRGGTLADIPQAIRTRYSPIRWSSPTMGFSGEANYGAATNRVTIEWSQPGSKSGTEALATSFMPCSIAYLGDDKLAVGGLEDDGDTVIEVWLLRAPLIVHDIQTGESVIVGRGTARRSKVHEATETGKHLVQMIIPFLDNSSAMLVQYWDSSDFYRVALAGGGHVLIASPDPQTSGTYVPGLATPHLAHWSGRHLQKGYIYVVGDASQVRDITIFVDSDADTSIDTVETHDLDSFVADGLSDSSLYY